MDHITKMYLMASKDIHPNKIDFISNSELFKLIDDFSKLSERVQDFIIWNYVNSPNKYKFI